MLGLLRSIRRNGFTKAPASALRPTKVPSAPRPTIHFQSALNAPITAMQEPTALSITSSPLTRGNFTSAQIDTLDKAFRSAAVQNGASAVRFKLLKLVEAAALRSEINRAIAAMDVEAVTPEAVVTVLRQRETEIDDLIEAVKEDHASHDAVSKARRKRLEPLRTATSEKLLSLKNGLDALVREADALRRPPPDMVGTTEARRAILAAAGLSREEISALTSGSLGPTREEQLAQNQARIAEIKAAMEPLVEFGKTGDESLLAGLVEFEPLIAARRLLEVDEQATV